MQVVHRIRLRPYVAHDEISNITVNQRELSPDADAAEDTEILGANLRGQDEHKIRDKLESVDQLTTKIDAKTIYEESVEKSTVRRLALRRVTSHGRTTSRLS